MFLTTRVAPDTAASAESLTVPHRDESPCAETGATNGPPTNKDPSTKMKVFFEEKPRLSREIIFYAPNFVVLPFLRPADASTACFL
jgi:hypothetical protein